MKRKRLHRYESCVLYLVMFLNQGRQKHFWSSLRACTPYSLFPNLTLLFHYTCDAKSTRLYVSSRGQILGVSVLKLGYRFCNCICFVKIVMVSIPWLQKQGCLAIAGHLMFNKKTMFLLYWNKALQPLFKDIIPNVRFRILWLLCYTIKENLDNNQKFKYSNRTSW